MKFDFSKMFYEGLDFEDPNIASIIAEHYEYKRLETSTKETIPERGKPLLHQREIKQMFLFMDSLILIHSVGTGKTCAITQSLEQFKDAVTSAIADYITQYLVPETVPYKKFYILVKGPILEESFKQQIICKCTAKGVYDSEILNSQTARRKESSIQKALEEYYEFIGYTTLATEIKNILEPERKNLTDVQYKQIVEQGKQRLIEKYSNCIFVADEVHVLTSDKDSKENKGRYKYIHELLHLVKNIKIMLATASPMKNSSTEFADILNLILPSDNQVSRSLFRDAFPASNQFNAEDSEEEAEEKARHVRKYSEEEAKQLLLPYFRGKISFLRATDINVEIRDHNHFPELQNNDELQNNGKDLNIMPEDEYPFYVDPVTIVNPEHIKVYKEAKQLRFKKNSGVYNVERQLANAWLPSENNRTGKILSHDFFNKLFKETGMFYSFKKEGNEEFERKYLQRRDENSTSLPPFYNISPKTVECGEILLKVDKTKQFRKTVIYSNFRDMGVNIISVGLMYVYGYEPYNGEKFFDDKNIGTSYCNVATQKKLKKDVRKKKRFAILLPRKDNEEILNIYNSYENRYGDYIQVLLIPQLGREGINTNEVHTFINVDAHWNPTNYGQALGRVMRADAFIWSLQELRNQMLQRGENPENARIIVDVFNLAIFLNDEDRDPEDDTNDIDVLLYVTSIEKDKEIQKVLRFCKETAVDCFIHYHRNYRENDVDKSPICNYETCKYECAVEKQPTDKIIYDMYDILYSKPEVDDAKIFLQKLFETHFSISYQNLIQLMPEYRHIVIILALNELISERYSLVDKFGNSVYLREDNGTFFIQQEYPTEHFTAPYAMSEYVHNTPVVLPHSLTDVLMQSAVRNTKKLMKNEKITPDEIDDMDLLEKVTLIEEIIIHNSPQINLDKYTGVGNEFFNHYTNRIYSFKEPETLLNEQASGTAIWDKRGRKPENIDNVKFHPLKTEEFEKYSNYIQYEQKEQSETIWVHALLSFEQTAEFERYLKGEAVIRVFKPSEGEWRDSNPYETVVYNGIIQVFIKELLDKLNKAKFYAYITTSGKGEQMKIIDVENKPKERKKDKDREKVDLRTRTKGVLVEDFISIPKDLKRFNDTFKSQAKTVNDIEKILSQHDLIVYLSL